jgi:WD40 repeat protein
VNERQLTELLRGAPLPNAVQAEERGWRVVSAAFNRRLPAARRTRPRRFVIAIALAILVLVLILTPAGAKVVDLVHDVIHPGAKHAKPLTSLPAPGHVLVDSPQGPWVVNQDGSKRLLGDYRAATWSPHGYYLAVTAGDQLSAVEPDGTVHWSITRHHPTDARWGGPDGFRIAYRTGTSMRVIAGDSTCDHLLASHVASTPPAWRPVAPPEAKVSPACAGGYEVALATPDGRVEVLDADSRKVLSRSRPGPVPTELDWSADGSRLVALSGSSIRVFGADGSLIRTWRLPHAMQATTGDFAPRGMTFAVVGSSTSGGRTHSAVFLVEVGSSGATVKRLFPEPGRFTGLSWSPNGDWLLVPWRTADQWLFFRPNQPDHFKTAGDVTRAFNPGSTGPSAFPRLAGWCCTAAGAS